MGRPIPRPEQGSDDDEAAFSSRLFTIAQPSDPNASQSLQGLFCSTVGCKDDDSSSEDLDPSFAFCSMMGEDDAARHLEYALLVPAARSPSKWPILLWIHLWQLSIAVAFLGVFQRSCGARNIHGRHT